MISYFAFGFVYGIWALTIEGSNKEHWAGTILISLFTWPVLIVVHWYEIPFNVRQFILAFINVIAILSVILLLTLAQ